MTIEQKEAVNSLETALEKIWALCKDSSVTVDGFLEMRRRDNELEENRHNTPFLLATPLGWQPLLK